MAIWWCSNGNKEDLAARLLEEEEMAQRVEERVRERVAAALESEAVQKQIEARLREERTALEQKVTFPIHGDLCHGILSMSASYACGSLVSAQYFRPMLMQVSRYGTSGAWNEAEEQCIPVREDSHSVEAVGEASGQVFDRVGCLQVTRQLELEKAQLLEKKRQEQEDRRRKQEELDQILLENRRKVRAFAAALRCNVLKATSTSWNLYEVAGQ